jgi:hypothetical protein
MRFTVFKAPYVQISWNSHGDEGGRSERKNRVVGSRDNAIFLLDFIKYHLFFLLVLKRILLQDRCRVRKGNVRGCRFRLFQFENTFSKINRDLALF